MKRKLIEFKCDYCGNIETVESAEAEVPYEKGWYYLDNIAGKVLIKGNEGIQIGQFNEIKKHFCKTECQLAFIGHLMTEASNPMPATPPETLPSFP